MAFENYLSGSGSWDNRRFGGMTRQQQDLQDRLGYSLDAGTSTFNDPRFLKDLRDEYEERGLPVNTMTDEELVRRMVSDRAWADMNIGSAAIDFFEDRRASGDVQDRRARLQRMYEAYPNFWEEGGRGAAGLADNVAAAFSDPVNVAVGIASLFTGGGAAAGYGAARGALTTGARAGLSEIPRTAARTAVRRGALAQAGRTAAIEAGISAPLEAGLSDLNQRRLMALGLQDEYSLRQTALAGASGAVLGGAVGGAMGLPAGIMAGRLAADQVPKLRQLGISDAEIATLTASEAADILANPTSEFARNSILRSQAAEPPSTPNEATADPTSPIAQTNPQAQLAPDTVAQEAMPQSPAGAAPSAPQEQVAPPPEQVAPTQETTTTAETTAAAEEPAPAPPPDPTPEAPAPQDGQAAALGEAEASPSAAPDQQTLAAEEAPRRAERDPSIPFTAQERRNRALAISQGVDPAALPLTSKGRISSKGLTKLVAERQAPDRYAAEVSETLEEFYDLTRYHSQNADAVNKAVRLLAQSLDSGRRMDVEALNDLRMNQWSETGRIDKDSGVFLYSSSEGAPRDILKELQDQGLTMTQAKRANTIVANLVLGDGVPLDEAIQRAARTALETANMPKRSEARGMFNNIESRATPLEKAPNIVSEGRDVGGGRTITDGTAPRASMLGYEEAVATAARRGRFAIQPFTLGQRMKAFGPKGLVTLNRGQTGFVTPSRPGRVYTSEDMALRANGSTNKITKDELEAIRRATDASPASEAADAPTPEAEAPATGDRTATLRQLMDQYADDPAGFKAELKRLMTESEPVGFGRSEPTNPPATQDGKDLLIIRRREDGLVRLMGRQQADDGGTIEGLIGSSGTVADWEVRYVPRDRAPAKGTNDQALLTKLFDEHGRAPESGGIEPYGSVSPEASMTMDEAATARLDSSTLTPDEVEALGPFATELSNVAQLQQILMLEHSRSFERINSLEDHTGKLLVLENLLRKKAPRGISLPNESRPASVEQVQNIFSARDPEAVNDAMEFISRLAGTDGPSIREAGPSEPNSGYRPSLIDAEPTQSISLRMTDRGRKLHPSIVDLYHEVAHWAYFNILTPEDRMRFWDSMNKYFDAGGTADQVLLKKGVADPNGENFGGVSVASNSTSSPQEFFASQFAMWAGRRRKDLVAGDESYWKKIGRYVKAVYDRYVRGVAIDPDLEPIFAKILPDHEKVVRETGDYLGNPDPDSTAGRLAFQLRRLADARRGMDEALTSGTPEQIIDAAQGVLGRFLSLGIYVKGQAPDTKVKLHPALNGNRRLVMQLSQRANDIAEILDKGHVNAEFVDDGGSRVSIMEAADRAADRLTPEEVSLELRKAWTLGYQEGGFTPSSGVPARISRLDQTTIEAAIVNLKSALDIEFKKASGSSAAEPAGITPELHNSARAVQDMVSEYSRLKAQETPNTARLSRLEEMLGRLEGTIEEMQRKMIERGHARAVDFKRKKNQVKRVSKAREESAKKTVRTPEKDRPSAKSPKLGTPGDYASMSLPDLKVAYHQNRGTKVGDQIADQMMMKLRSRIDIGDAKKTHARTLPAGLKGLSLEDLKARYIEAVVDGDKPKMFQLETAISVEGYNQRAGTQSAPRIPVTFKRVQGLVENERAAWQGAPITRGVPPDGPAYISEAASYIQHRDPEIESVSRTMFYRLANVMGRAIPKPDDGVNIMSLADMARLAGERLLPDDRAAFTDFDHPHFQKARSKIRGLAIGLNRGNASPEDIIHELGHVVMRSGVVSEEMADEILVAFRASDDPLKDKVVKEYASRYADAPDPEMALAEEYFSEFMVQYASGRMARQDAIMRLIGRSGASQRLARVLDELVETVAYVMNGLVGRNDIKQQFRRLSLYGDMLEKKGSATATTPRILDRVAVAPRFAASRVADVWRRTPSKSKQAVANYTKGAYGASGRTSEQPMVFYHATPSGSALARETDPNVVLTPSRIGQYGPGTYVSVDPTLVEDVYGQRPTPESLISRYARARGLDADDGLPDDEAANEFLELASELNMVRRIVDTHRFKYSNAKRTGEGDLEDLAETIELGILEEANIMRQMESKFGVEYSPVVLPLYTSIKKPLDLREGKTYLANGELFEGFMRALYQSDVLDDDGIVDATEMMLPDYVDSDGTMSGKKLWEFFEDALMEHGYGIGSPDEASGVLNQVARDMGYDGMITTHFNYGAAPNSPRTSMGEMSIPYEVQKTRHETLVVFEPENLKHIEASEFDGSKPQLYARNQSIIPSGAIGAALSDVTLASDSHGLPAAAIADYASRATGDPMVGSALATMARGRNLTANQQAAVRKYSPSGVIARQSEQLRNMGMNWLAPWYKDFFPTHNQRLAKRLLPIQNELAKLPDSPGGLRRWAQRSNPFRRPPVPASHMRIMKALRDPGSPGSPSKRWQALSANEAEVANQIRKIFNDEWDELRELGVQLGRRGNYAGPQIWASDLINRSAESKQKFLDGMVNYYNIAETKAGRVPDPDDAMSFANKIHQKVANDGEYSDGDIVPVGALSASGRKGTTLDSLKYSRVIELEKHPEALEALEPFLENDIDALMTKYLDGTTRHKIFVDKVGQKSHALYDYITVADEGQAGIAKLLSTNKVFNEDYTTVKDNEPAEQSYKITIGAPFAGREMEAQKFAADLIKAHQTSGPGAARAMMDRIAPRGPGGKPPITWQRRAEAILGALDDFNGKRTEIPAREVRFVENAMRVMNNTSVIGDSDKGQKAARAIRGFNNVTLLSFTTLTSLGEPLLALVRSGDFRAWTKGMYLAASDKHYRRALHEIGAAMENVTHDRMTNLYGGADTRTQNAFFNATMLTPWTNLVRNLSASVGVNYFAAMQAKALDNYTPGLHPKDQNRDYRIAHRSLVAMGLGDFLPDGPMSHKSIFDPETRIELMENNDAFRTAVVKFADQSAFSPNADDIPVWGRTWAGSLITQLKSFPLMMHRMIRDHVVAEAFPPKGEPRNLKPLMYMATIAPAAGVGVTMTKDYVQMRGGEENREAALRDRNFFGEDGGIEGELLAWYLQGAATAGGLGLIGDVLTGVADQAENGAYGQVRTLSLLGGPTVGLLAAGTTIVGGALDNPRREWLGGEDTTNSKERAAVREVATRIPFAGGIRGVREGMVDAVAGEAESPSGGGGGGRATISRAEVSR